MTADLSVGTGALMSSDDGNNSQALRSPELAVGWMFVGLSFLLVVGLGFLLAVTALLPLFLMAGVTALLVALAVVLGRFVSLRSTVGHLLLSVGLGAAVLVGGAAIWAAIGFYSGVEPRDAMILGVLSWLSAVLVAFGSLTFGPPSAVSSLGIALAAVMVVVPFVIDGAAKAGEDREVLYSAIDSCETGVSSDVGAMQYKFVEADVKDTPVPSDWSDARVIGFVNGQALAPMGWPPILAHGQVMERRYLIDGAVANEGAYQELENEQLNAFFRILRLGNEGFSAWYGIVSTCGAPGA